MGHYTLKHDMYSYDFLTKVLCACLTFGFGFTQRDYFLS